MRREREQCPAQADIDYIAAESRLAVPDKEAESVEPAAEQAVPLIGILLFVIIKIIHNINPFCIRVYRPAGNQACRKLLQALKI